MDTVTSADGTSIAFPRLGSGSPVVVVGGATCDRATTAPLAQQPARHFTVVDYDRRGRGDSGDTAPYAVEREVEDLAAPVAEAGAGARRAPRCSSRCWRGSSPPDAARRLGADPRLSRRDDGWSAASGPRALPLTTLRPVPTEPSAVAIDLPPGAATGVGSLPGTDVREAVRVVLGELPDLPHLPELPARGPGADAVGRTAALLVDLHVDRQPSGWRLVDRPGVDERRATSYLAQDLDALEEAAQGWTGPLKVQLVGPWTLAAAVELPRGDRALSDLGATRDVAASLAEAVAAHVADLRRRVPGARLVVQIDEPGLPAVLAGHVPTASGYDVLPAVEAPLATGALREVVTAGHAAGAAVAVHCCAARVPLRLLRAAGADAVSVDATLLREADDEALGELVDAGVGLWLGLVPTGATPRQVSQDRPVLSDPAGTVGPARRLWRRLGFPAEQLARSVVVTPTCGLAGVSPADARAALARARVAGRALVDDPEG